jgi:hypothetical protein
MFGGRVPTSKLEQTIEPLLMQHTIAGQTTEQIREATFELASAVGDSRCAQLTSYIDFVH